MNRRGYLGGLAASLLLGPLAAQAQQAGKVHRIGCLWAVPREAATPYIQELGAGLNDLGHIEGVNVALEHRFADPPEDVSRFADALVRSNVDALLATTNYVIAAAKRATTTIPIVMLYAADPVGAGLIDSMARPGGNVTGLSFDAAPEIYGKHVELLKAIAPAETRVGGLRNLTYYQQSPGHGPYVSAVSESARRLGLGLRFFNIRSSGDIEGAFRQMARAGVRAIFILPDPVTFTHSRQIASLAVRSRISSIYGYRDAVEAGGLLSYGADIREAPRRAAIYLDRIFKGAKPGDLPVEQPTTFELVINLRTAKALGLTIPQTLLIRANHVIE